MKYCDTDSVFACETFSSLKAYGKNCSWVYGGFDEKSGIPFCSIKTVTTGYIFYADNLKEEKLPSISEFFKFLPKRDIIASKDNILKLQKMLGGNFQEKLIMKKSYDSVANDSFKNDDEVVHPIRYIDMFNILTTRFEDDCPKELKNDWIYTTSLKERKAESKALCIYQDEKCVSCGFLDSVNSYCGIIASLATFEGFERKGYGTKIVNSLLNSEQMKNKNAYVVLMDNNLEEFYKRLGFENSGSYCILTF